MQPAGPTIEPTEPPALADTLDPSEPAGPIEGRSPADERPWRRRLLMALLALAVLAVSVGVIALLLAALRSDDPPPRPAFAERVEILDAGGGFEAVTTNLGRRARAPTCTVDAFDIYGNRVGSKVYELDAIPAGETVEWDGTVPVTATVERMSIGCD
jgi:hypothetical protein